MRPTHEISLSLMGRFCLYIMGQMNIIFQMRYLMCPTHETSLTLVGGVHLSVSEMFYAPSA